MSLQARGGAPRLSRSFSIMSATSGMEAGAWLWHKGGLRTTWDGLRKDVDLWSTEGDCLVYLYARGASKRPASIRVPLRAIVAAGCTELLLKVENSPSSAPDSDASSVYSSSRRSSTRIQPELFLGAPKHLNRDDTFRWHLTTRNFFAWLLHKPLAGPHLGVALGDLLHRMNLYRASGTDNVEHLLAYADDMDYTNLSNHPDYAAAMLVFAEEHKLTDIWIDACAHCVGMNDLLSQAPDFEVIGNVTKALMTKAFIQMDMDLDANSCAIASLLEDDFRTHLGLIPGARQHLNDFRSFLQAHFVGAYGYWPPQSDLFHKKLYTSMLEDFEQLYDLLADFRPSDTRVSATGGICVMQNIKSFDSRHGFAPLDAALPLLPNLAAEHRKQVNRASWRGFISSKDKKDMISAKSKAAHLLASNYQGERWQRTPLVQGYLDFEIQSVESLGNELSMDDARKVRWMLIYGMVQLLRAVLYAAPEVTGRDGVIYPLCCQSLSIPPWERSPTWHSSTSSLSVAQNSPSGSSVSIHPDGETDYDRYFSSSSRVDDQQYIHPALRRIMPLRTKAGRSLRSVRRLSTVSLAFSSVREDEIIQENQDEPTPVDGKESPGSETPSLDWSRLSQEDSPVSGRTSDEEMRRLSTTSSVYSNRPELPTKLCKIDDVLDKGLAFEDFVCPGLY